MVLDILDGTVRGELVSSVSYFESEEQARGPLQPGLEFKSLFMLRFPVDDCESSELPLAADEPSALLGGRTPLDLRAQVQDELAGMGPFSARWLDEALGEVSVELDLSAPAPLCASSEWLGTQDERTLAVAQEGGIAVVRGWSGARLRGDRGLDVELYSISIAASAGTGELRWASFRRDEYEIDAAELQARTGLSVESTGTPLQASAELTYTFQAESAVEVYGKVEVATSENSARRVECLGWPLDGSADKDCQYE
jgi:hypothetical protein